MQAYKKEFLERNGLEEGDFIPCQLCGGEAVDIHHVNSSFRGKRSVDPGGLIALCRYHHDWVHERNNKEMRDYLLRIINNNATT